MGVAPSPLVDDPDIEITAIPRAEKSLGLADQHQTILFALTHSAKLWPPNIPTEKKVAYWENQAGVDEISKEEFFIRTRELHSSRIAFSALKDSQDFFDKLNKHYNASKKIEK
jgi:hypothetical protein